MSTGYYLQDHPNTTTAQYGWERAKLGQAGQHLSGAFGVHTTENLTSFFGPDYNAENVAHFISTRADHGGYHVVSDADSIVLLVHPRYAAWADTTNNAHALSVSGSLQAARWLEMTPERRRQVVVNMGKAAAQIALIAVRDGYLAAVPPARRISAQQAIAGTAAGFYGHGETNPGTRYDPGLHFDWNLFLSSYAAAVGGGIIPQGTTPIQEDELSKEQYDELRAIAVETQVRVTKARDDAAMAVRLATENQRRVTENQRRITETREIVKQIASSAGAAIDYAKIDEIVDTSLAAGVDVRISVQGQEAV